MHKMVDHFGVPIAETPSEGSPLRHAQTIQQRSGELPQELPKAVAPGQTFLAEMDGTMVLSVRRATQGDRRQDKSVQWQVARVQGSEELTYAATLLGDVHGG